MFRCKRAQHWKKKRSLRIQVKTMSSRVEFWILGGLRCSDAPGVCLGFWSVGVRGVSYPPQLCLSHFLATDGFIECQKSISTHFCNTCTENACTFILGLHVCKTHLVKPLTSILAEYMLNLLGIKDIFHMNKSCMEDTMKKKIIS